MSAWLGLTCDSFSQNLADTQYQYGILSIHCKGPLYCTVRAYYWATLVDLLIDFDILFY